jgi:hypothetical protein
MRPNFHPEGLFEENKFDENKAKSSTPIKQLWHANGECEEGTIPIRRTKEEDVLRASSVKRYGRKKHKSIPKPRSADPDLVNQSGHQVRRCFESLPCCSERVVFNVLETEPDTKPESETLIGLVHGSTG